MSLYFDTPDADLVAAGRKRMDEARMVAYQAKSDTSRAAAHSILPATGTLREKVLATITQHGPCTDESICAHLDMNPSTERPRRKELVDAGLVVDTGRRATTLSGRKAVMWEIA